MEFMFLEQPVEITNNSKSPTSIPNSSDEKPPSVETKVCPESDDTGD